MIERKKTPVCAGVFWILPLFPLYRVELGKSARLPELYLYYYVLLMDYFADRGLDEFVVFGEAALPDQVQREIQVSLRSALRAPVEMT